VRSDEVHVRRNRSSVRSLLTHVRAGQVLVRMFPTCVRTNQLLVRSLRPRSLNNQATRVARNMKGKKPRRGGRRSGRTCMGGELYRWPSSRGALTCTRRSDTSWRGTSSCSP
jgi:hypothetical protein